MKDQITYTGSTRVTVKLGGMSKSPKRVIKNGDTVKRGEIPDDAYSYLEGRPDFGGDLDKYLARKGQRVAGTIAAPKKPKGKPKASKKAKPEMAKE